MVRAAPSNFTNVVLIMTSNLPIDPKDYFKPEFVNRIDDIVRFSELSIDDLVEIVDIQLRGLANRLADRRLTLEVTDEAKARIAELGHDPAYGARPLKRVIQRELADRIAVALLEGEFPEGSTVQVDLDGDELVVRRGENVLAA